MRLKKGDVMLTALVLLAALSLFLVFLRMPSQNVTAVISLDGTVKDKIALTGLSEPITFEYQNLGYRNIVRAENGRIRVEAADCPDKVCLNTGWISRPGQSIICLPAHLVIRIEGTNGNNNVDTVVG